MIHYLSGAWDSYMGHAEWEGEGLAKARFAQSRLRHRRKRFNVWSGHPCKALCPSCVLLPCAVPLCCAKVVVPVKGGIDVVTNESMDGDRMG